MTATSVETIRVNLWTRRERSRQAQNALQEALAADRWLEPVHVHCAGKGCSARLATVIEFADGRLLFVSKIEERPADELDHPPWFIDHMLAGVLDLPGSDDDATVVRCVEQWNERPHRPEERQRWRVLRPSLWVDLLTLPSDLGDGWQPELWVRCKNHPGGVQAVARKTMLDAASRAQQLGKRQVIQARQTITP